MFPFQGPNQYQEEERRKKIIAEHEKKVRDNLERWHTEFIKSDPFYQFDDTTYVYFIQSADGTMVKIGQSYRVYKRIFAALDLFPDGIKIIGLLKDRDEYQIHNKFNHLRIQQPKGEVFRYSDEITQFLNDSMSMEEVRQMKTLNEHLTRMLSIGVTK